MGSKERESESSLEVCPRESCPRIHAWPHTCVHMASTHQDSVGEEERGDMKTKGLKDMFWAQAVQGEREGRVRGAYA